MSGRGPRIVWYANELRFSSTTKPLLAPFLHPMPDSATSTLIWSDPSPSNGQTFLLTCVDRFTRWAEAIPIPDSKTETVVRAFLYHWVARFGSPPTEASNSKAAFSALLHISWAVNGSAQQLITQQQTVS